MKDLGSMLGKIVADALQPVIRDLHMLKSAYSRTIKEGFVEEGDAAKGYRINFGEDDKGKYLSSWVPHPETGKTSMPLKNRQRVVAIAPGGDLSRALLVPAGYSDEFPSPNDDMEANVFEDAGVKATVRDGSLKTEIGGATFTQTAQGLAMTIGGATYTFTPDGLTMTVGGATYAFTSGGFAQTGGQQLHDGKDVGATSSHTGVTPGGGTTGPVA